MELQIPESGEEYELVDLPAEPAPAPVVGAPALPKGA